MKKIKNFRDLIAWQAASELVKDIANKFTKNFPKSEKYRLTDQIIRPSRSVPSQIAEGFRRSSLKDKYHFCEMGTTSGDETENHLYDAFGNKYTDNKTYKHYLYRIIRVRLLLSRLTKSVRELMTAHDNEPQPSCNNLYRIFTL